MRIECEPRDTGRLFTKSPELLLSSPSMEILAHGLVLIVRNPVPVGMASGGSGVGLYRYGYAVGSWLAQNVSALSFTPERLAESFRIAVSRAVGARSGVGDDSFDKAVAT